MDISNIVEMKIYYENCEKFTLSGSHIKAFQLETIKQKLEIGGQQPIERFKTAQSVHVVIHSEANQAGALWMEAKVTPFQRTARLKDIVYFILTYKNGTTEKVVPLWAGNNIFKNPNQTSFINEAGDLVINITEEITGELI